MKLKDEVRMKTVIKIILPGDKPLNIDLSQENLNWELEEIDEREMGVELGEGRGR